MSLYFSSVSLLRLAKLTSEFEATKTAQLETVREFTVIDDDAVKCRKNDSDEPRGAAGFKEPDVGFVFGRKNLTKQRMVRPGKTKQSMIVVNCGILYYNYYIFSSM